MAKSNNELTPMQRQYNEIKEANQDCILFFRLGDFYEMFNEDAQLAARELGLTEYRSGLLPQDKLTAVQTMLNEGRTVAFVGDGVNDAPVLSAAQVGVAMGGVGSDAAVEASDLVLLKDDLAGLPRALKIARRTIAIARQNIAFALVIKFGVMLLSIPGIANMWMAVFADVGVAMLCILNSFRAMKSDV